MLPLLLLLTLHEMNPQEFLTANQKRLLMTKEGTLLLDWSNDHPGHQTIFVSLEPKDDLAGFAPEEAEWDGHLPKYVAQGGAQRLRCWPTCISTGESAVACPWVRSATIHQLFVTADFPIGRGDGNQSKKLAVTLPMEPSSDKSRATWQHRTFNQPLRRWPKKP